MSGAIVWITGLPSAGKSTLAVRARERLRERGREVCVLDSDDVRKALHPAPGYSPSARERFYETLGDLALMLSRQGLIVLVAATASQRRFRDRVREHASRFLEVHVDTGLDECMERDAKGLYKESAAGRISGLPGVDVAYQRPLEPDIVAHGGHDENALARLVTLVDGRTPAS